MALDPGRVTVPVRTTPAGDELARMVKWVLDDLAYCAPEDLERQHRDFRVLRDALEDYNEAVGP